MATDTALLAIDTQAGTVGAGYRRGLQRHLLTDGYTTEDIRAFPTTQLIAHHNRTPGPLAYPDHPIAVRPRAEIAR